MAKATRKTTTKPRAKETSTSADNEPRKKLFDLETLICDLDLMIDVLRSVSEDNLTIRGDVTLTNAETDRMYFVLCHVCEYSKRLRKFYYSDAAA